MEAVKWVLSIIAAFLVVILVASVGVGIAALLAIGGVVVFILFIAAAIKGSIGSDSE